MRIITLMEDTKGDSECIHEHGLSIYIETEEHTILVDTGATDAFIQNANRLHIDLNKVDAVIISHGHYDHAGGLMSLLQINNHAKIYMQRKAPEGYYHVNDTLEKYIGINQDILKSKQLVLLDGEQKLDEELTLFTNITGRKLWPKGNLELKHKGDFGFEQDSFDHEQCLVIQQNGKHYLCSGCAHNGILNIMDAYQERFHAVPDVVISGFHMMQKSGYQEEDIRNIKENAQLLRQYKTKFYTGHCTGKEPFLYLKEIMGEQIEAIHSGDEIKL